MPKLTTPLVTPITEFTLACDRILNGPITRNALTKDELDILKMGVRRLTEKFFTPPDVRSPVMLPHGAGAVE